MYSALTKLKLLVATGLGVGYLVPIGQGTIAALITLAVVPSFTALRIQVQLATIALAFLIGGWVSSVKASGFTKDDHRIVIDEVVSILISFAGLKSLDWSMLLVLGFLLNRTLDIWKPYPLRALESLPSGWGIMADDALGGVITNLLLRLIIFLKP